MCFASKHLNHKLSLSSKRLAVRAPYKGLLWSNPSVGATSITLKFWGYLWLMSSKILEPDHMARCPELLLTNIS